MYFGRSWRQEHPEIHNAVDRKAKKKWMPLCYPLFLMSVLFVLLRRLDADPDWRARDQQEIKFASIKVDLRLV